MIERMFRSAGGPAGAAGLATAPASRFACEALSTAGGVPAVASGVDDFEQAPAKSAAKSVIPMCRDQITTEYVRHRPR